MKNTSISRKYSISCGLSVATVPGQNTGPDTRPATSLYRLNESHDKHFAVPVLGQSVSIISGLIPEPALGPRGKSARNTLYFMI